MILTKVFNFEKEEAGIQFQISSELFPILRVKESDNFAGYNFNSRSKERERERVSATRIERGKYCSMHSARRHDTQREKERGRENGSTPPDWYLASANVYVLASAYIISRHSWRACCA